MEIAKQITSLNLRRGNGPSGRWQKCLDSESKCEGAKVGLGATTPSINTRVEAHANSDTMVVIIPVNIAIVFRSRTEGANLKESPSRSVENYYARMELVAIWLYFYGDSRRANIAFWLVVAIRRSCIACVRLIQVEQVVKRSTKTKY